MECSYATAVMDKIGGWEEENEQRKQSGATPKHQVRHGQKDMDNFIHITPECTSSKQDLGLVLWASRMETTEFNGDLAMPGSMHWWLLWYSAPSHLNEILIKGCVFQTCHDKTTKEAMETSFTRSFGEGHTPRSAFLVTQKMMMIHHLQR